MAAPAPYRFVGTTKSGIAGTRIEVSRFGQPFEFDPDIIEPLIGGLDINGHPYGGFLAMPEAEWQKLGISNDELKTHGPKIAQGKEPDDFRAKKESAWAAHAEYVKSKHQPPVEPAAATDEAGKA